MFSRTCVLLAPGGSRLRVAEHETATPLWLVAGELNLDGENGRATRGWSVDRLTERLVNNYRKIGNEEIETGWLDELDPSNICPATHIHEQRAEL